MIRYSWAGSGVVSNLREGGEGEGNRRRRKGGGEGAFIGSESTVKEMDESLEEKPQNIS